jgi:hypothetical protein
MVILYVILLYVEEVEYGNLATAALIDAEFTIRSNKANLSTEIQEWAVRNG